MTCYKKKKNKGRELHDVANCPKLIMKDFLEEIIFN